MAIGRWLRAQLSGPTDMAKVRLSGLAVAVGLLLAFFWISFDSARRVAALEVALSGTRVRLRATEAALERSLSAQETLGTELRQTGEQFERKVAEVREVGAKQAAALADVKEALGKNAVAVAELREAAGKEAARLTAEVAAHGTKLGKLLVDYASHTALNLELATSVEAAHKSLNETTKMIASFHEYFRKREQQLAAVSKSDSVAERSRMADIRLRLARVEALVEGSAGGASGIFKKLELN